ncbi:MAG: glycosyltransferase family 39 protein [Elusimicrobia bacterium]|nr:glycosyltransferase family 39 protein [Elusimicrobiota bacterium]
MTPRRWLYVLLAAAFAARLAFCWKFPQGLADGGVPDYDRYHRLAISLLQHGSLLDDDGAMTAMREPGYPFVLAGLYAVAGPRYWAVCLLHAVLGALTALLVFKLGLRVFGPFTAWLAAAMAAFHPQLLYYSALPRRETFQALLLAASAWALLDACEKPGRGRVLLAAFLWALNPLTNSAFLPAGLGAAAALVLIGRRRGLRTAGAAALFLAVFMGLYALWPLRNFGVFHRFIPGITGGGNHIYIGLAVPDDIAGTPEEQKIILSDPVIIEAGRLAEDQKDAVFYRGAAQWIRAHPALFVGRMWGSFVKLWRLYPYPRDYGMNYRLIKWVSLLSDGWIIPLGLAGLLLAGRRYPETDLFNLTLASVTLTYMVFWSIIRYRVPLMPFVFVYAAYAVRRGLEAAGLLKAEAP